MNKEYEDLLNYITTFERSQQQEEIKLAEEVAKHKHTQQSIRNAQANIERYKQSLEAMQNSMKNMRRQHLEEKKASKQLRDATKHLKEELRLLDERVIKASEEASKKRAFYTLAMEQAKERSRLLQLAYARGDCTSAVASLSTSSSDEAAEEKQLKQKLELLKARLQTELDEKEKLQMMKQKKKRDEEAAAHPTPMDTENAAAAKVAEREAELLLHRNVVQGQKDLLEQQKKLQESTIKEFHDLDGYGTKLNQTYEELQQYCSELEAAEVPPCSRCNKKKGEKHGQQEDPIVQD
ncbi:uncharacterized protein ACA1_333240 [Acanthamoeba castellanii str. Neff]|uniref:Uncharacterized protein n=1 Tax=Acanthamoeba castellanii (strain ATCC 30010 / Neff) TaxID=1257118 RepID=L8HFY0_ACACF|nr:uncharacterized protein ACA1_333240 [Acanthamoeba castellanii str. Neff]ELR24444.1 hypothetical protein ACA1_333240 [Acanthamoeba castellanii str. Neff]